MRALYFSRKLESMNEKRISYLESKLPVPEQELVDKYWSGFEKYATYMGGGVYSWNGFLSTDTRELWLMGILHRMNVKFKMS